MSRPNILLICADQHRYDALGCYGNEIVETPALDRLAAGGTRFDQCYTPNPVCAPTRASMFTGVFPHVHGLWANGVSLPPARPLLGRTLTDSGYDCGLVGKLHLGPCFGGRTERRLDDGFRVFGWAHDPSHSSPDNQYHHWLRREFPDLWQRPSGGPGAPDRTAARRGDDMPREAHYSHWVAEQTIDFLRTGRDTSRPFFFVANFFDPHHPFVAPREYVDKYRERIADPIRAPRPDERPIPIQLETSRESYAGHARGFASYGRAEMRDVIAAYYGMVDLVDDEVARILDALTRLGLIDDTLVLYTSDHGEMLGDHAQLLKGPLFYEGAVRVPMIARWPGHIPVGANHDLVQVHDVYATVLAAAGLDNPPYSQSVDLAPIAAGSGDRRGWALTEYRDSGHPLTPPVHATMLRAGHDKLVVHHGRPNTSRPRTGELYDLEADPQELTNRWDDPSYRTPRREPTELLIDILVAGEDRSAVREAFW